MIDLATAATMAKVLADGVGAFDKIFRGLNEFISKRKVDTSGAPPPDLSYRNEPGQKALVAISQNTGEVRHTVTYDDLLSRVSPEEAAHVKALSQAISLYARQWDAITQEIPLASGLHRAQLEGQLDKVAKDMAGPLSEVLDFIERIGFFLDDHYHVARHITRSLRDE